MKKKIYYGLGLVIIVIIGYVGYLAMVSRSLSPSKTTAFDHQGLDITVTYCQPSKRGRVIFGEGKDALLPFGKYWRLGANDATEITFSKNINFGDKPVGAGTYRMYAIPGANSWQIVLNSQLGQSGATEPDYTLDVARVEVPAGTSPSEVEQFIIDFAGAGPAINMTFAWDKTVITVPVTLQ